MKPLPLVHQPASSHQKSMITKKTEETPSQSICSHHRSESKVRKNKFPPPCYSRALNLNKIHSKSWGQCLRLLSHDNRTISGSSTTGRVKRTRWIHRSWRISTKRTDWMRVMLPCTPWCAGSWGIPGQLALTRSVLMNSFNMLFASSASAMRIKVFSTSFSCLIKISEDILTTVNSNL